MNYDLPPRLGPEHTPSLASPYPRPPFYTFNSSPVHIHTHTSDTPRASSISTDHTVIGSISNPSPCITDGEHHEPINRDRLGNQGSLPYLQPPTLNTSVYAWPRWRTRSAAGFKAVGWGVCASEGEGWTEWRCWNAQSDWGTETRYSCVIINPAMSHLARAGILMSSYILISISGDHQVRSTTLDKTRCTGVCLPNVLLTCSERDGSSFSLSPLLYNLPSISGISSLKGYLPTSPSKNASKALPAVDSFQSNRGRLTLASWQHGDLGDGKGLR